MPWIVGVDEAGYGPNLGPFVMTTVACRVPDDCGANLWDHLRPAVRRHPGVDPTRLLVDDSKKVYSSGRGLEELERAALVHWIRCAEHENRTFGHFLEWFCPEQRAEVADECWFTGGTELPLHSQQTTLRAFADEFERKCAGCGCTWGLARGAVVCTARFNRLLSQYGSKGAILALTLNQLLGVMLAEYPDESLSFFIDKHGGRNFYAAALQSAFPERLVMAVEEGPNRSVYHVTEPGRTVKLTFQPRADSEHLCVALASMMSKYVREVLMAEFNAFWAERLPNLKPTAGYPVDAGRFYRAIEPLAHKLGLARAALWREK